MYRCNMPLCTGTEQLPLLPCPGTDPRLGVLRHLADDFLADAFVGELQLLPPLPLHAPLFPLSA